MSADQTTPAKQAGANNDVTSSASPAALKEWPLWEVFVRSKQGLSTSTAAVCTHPIHNTLCKWRAMFTRAAKKA